MDAGAAAASGRAAILYMMKSKIAKLHASYMIVNV